MHYRQAREEWVPTNWDRFLNQASADAEQAAIEQLVANGTPEDLRSTCLLQAGEIRKLKADLAAVTMAANMNAHTVREQQTEIARLTRIENAAMRVASSRRDGVVTDKGALDLLDAALEATHG